jgi:hypothetical protein
MAAVDVASIPKSHISGKFAQMANSGVSRTSVRSDYTKRGLLSGGVGCPKASTHSRRFRSAKYRLEIGGASSVVFVFQAFGNSFWVRFERLRECHFRNDETVAKFRHSDLNVGHQAVGLSSFRDTDP